MDISDTLAPNSDQLDAVDLLGGPRTFTITGVKRGSAEQPVDIQLAEFPRVWRPGKSMRRVLAACWGTDASVYVGRQVTLYCDEAVVFGGKPVGGTRISHLSHMDKPKHIPLLVSRGKSATFTVQPLPGAPKRTVQRRERTEPPSELPGHEAVIANAVADIKKLEAGPDTDQQALDAAAAVVADAGMTEGITRAQMTKLQATYTDLGITDRKSRLNYASDVVGRPLSTSADLTKAEASDVIDALEKEAKP